MFAVLRRRVSPSLKNATKVFSLFFSHRHRRGRRSPPLPPPPTSSEIASAISSLPPRFTTSDLTSAISLIPDPRLCLPLLFHSVKSPSPRRRPDCSSFLVAVRRLSAASLHSDLHSAATLALSLLPLTSLSHPFLHSLIIAYSRAPGMIPRSISIFKLMRSHPDPKCRPSLPTYNALLAALLGKPGKTSFVHHARMETLRCLFKQMVNAGVNPDIKTLNTMIRGYVLSLHLNDALRVFHQMTPVYGCDPDEETYNLLVSGLCAQGRTINARELLDEMRSKGMVPGARACCSMAAAFAVAGEADRAAEMVKEMVAMGRRPDSVTCEAVAEEMRRHGQRREASAMLLELREKGMVATRDYKQLLEE